MCAEPSDWSEDNRSEKKKMYIESVGKEKKQIPAADKAHALLMWGTFLWFTGEKFTGRVESVGRVGAGGFRDPETFSSLLFS